MKVSGLEVNLTNAAGAVGMMANEVSVAAGLVVSDSSIELSGNGSARDVRGLSFQEAVARVERTRVVVSNSAAVMGVQILQRLERRRVLPSSFRSGFSSGSTNNRGINTVYGSLGVMITNDGVQSRVRMVGSTIDPQGLPNQNAPTFGVVCRSDTPLLEQFHSNFVSSGRLLATRRGCPTASATSPRR